MLIEIEERSEHFPQAVSSGYFQLKENEILLQRLTLLKH